MVHQRRCILRDAVVASDKEIVCRGGEGRGVEQPGEGRMAGYLSS